MALQRHTQQVATPAVIPSRLAAEVMHEADRMAEYAMMSHTMLRKWADTLAGSDPVLHDDLCFFVAVSKLGKARIIENYMESRS